MEQFLGSDMVRWVVRLTAMMVLAAAVVVASADGSSAPAETRATPSAGDAELLEPETPNVELDDAEIEQRLFAAVANHTFASYFAWRYYAPDGTFINADIYGTRSTGKWWIKDREVCVKYDFGRSNTLCAQPDLSQFRPGKIPL